MTEYRIIRSKRKTMALQVYPDGTVVVRAPLRMSKEKIQRFVCDNEKWIMRKLQKVRSAAAVQPLSAGQIDALRKRAKEVLPKRAAYYAPLVGVDYGRITIRCQKTRWGSCSSAGNLNFNCLLMLAPPQAQDAVVVHELCHRLYMNHSPAFYAKVLSVYPEYRKWNGWLKQNGAALLAAVPRDE